MKAVQVGILVALVVCAGLLFKVYRGQQAAAPAPAPQVQAAPPAPTPAPAAQPAPAPAPQATVTEPVKPKPSPMRKRVRPVLVADNQQPAAPQDQPAPAAAPTPEPAPAAQPEPPAPRPLNPPPGTETAPPPREPHHVTIPAGTLLSVRLGETLSSERNQPGDSFTGTLDQPLIIDGFEIASRGSRVQGKVLEARPAGRVRGVSALAIQLVKIHTSDGQDVAVATERFAREGPTTHKEDATKVGVGAAIGAAIGAIAGGGKGAAIGAGVGGAAGAGTVAATRGKPSELPVETRITFKLEQPISLTERLH